MSYPLAFAVVSAVLCFGLSILFFKSVRSVFILMLQTVFGWAVLCLFNSLGIAGMILSVNPVSAAVAGVLGLPGFLLLLATSKLF